MNAAARQPSRDEVLDAFAVEADHGRETLERYLRLYPSFAREIVDFARELTREEVLPDASPLSEDELALIDAAWAQHLRAQPARGFDPFAALAPAQWIEVAHRLSLPRQVFTAFRERRVLLASVPRRFLERLAEAIHSSVDQIQNSWDQGTPLLARSYKANVKPKPGGPVPFAQVLREASVPLDQAARLLSGDE